MRQLYLLRGNVGSGKSTWLKNNELRPYTLCADEIRLMIESPVLKPDGGFGISQANEKKTWALLFEMLELRMSRGEIVFIDATHSKSTDFAKYKSLIDKYRYRIYCIDFTDVPLDECKKRNKQREEYKIVPEEYLERLDSRFNTQPLPSYVKRIKPEDFAVESQFYPLPFTDAYETIHVIGDIHGCMTVLNKYFEKYPFNDKDFYIFVGDYIDRGIENVQVVQWLLENYTKPNVLLLEGNHERWLRHWANGDLSEIKANEFIYNTMKDLNNSSLDIKEVRQLCRKFAQVAYFTFYDRYFLVSHGGISRMPQNMSFIATEQLIKGVGKYEDMKQVAESWKRLSWSNAYQICGHRNVTGEPTEVNSKFYNLEGKVEFGGELRTVSIGPLGIEVRNVANPVFKDQTQKKVEQQLDSPMFLAELRANRGIKEKAFGDISSFNFSRDVFFKSSWDRMNVKARGLFINTQTNEIVARSYDKFFNLNERRETELDKMTLQYPVDVYVKYNGFLGMLGYDTASDSLIWCSKSSLDGPFVDLFKRTFASVYPNADLDAIKRYLKDNNETFVFEIINVKEDPHIIEYAHDMVVLLDVVRRTTKYHKSSYAVTTMCAALFNFQSKLSLLTLTDNKDFYTWHQQVQKEPHEDIEGVVLEDSAGFMVKIKFPYYQFWKHMRSLKESVKKRHNVNLAALSTPEGNYFHAWLKTLPVTDLDKDIITLRKAFKGKDVATDIR